MTAADEARTTARSETGGVIDWGVGHYEATADRLMSAAHVVVQCAQLGAGDRVLDLGCGTGNAALLATEHGARVTGVDPAPRLLHVAQDRAAASGRQITFVLGAAESLPLEDASVDVVLSVFAVISANDPAAAAREIDRVLTADGRLGQAETVRTRLLQILEAENEAPGSFLATSRYIVATARRGATVGSERR
jgi:ubiquinone/menaquinone biosynthesis C-methylase UbiE